jgi:hypothetical protein
MSERNHSEAPIAIFVYKRPLHTARLIESLTRNEAASRWPVFVFSDGARFPEENEAVAATRRVVREKLGGCSELTERDTNLGLAASIIAGVTKLTAQYGRVIVLEDDLVLHSGCIDFLNAALRRYADETRVWHVNAYRYPIPEASAPSFSRLPSSWGWATWERAWAGFEPDAAKLERIVRESHLVSRMDFGGRFPYYTMLKHQVRGRIDSWAIRWYASVLIRGGLSVYPNVSQVTNTGIDGTGVHSGTTSAYDVPIGAASHDWPAEIIEDQATYLQMQAYFGKLTGSVVRRIARRLKRTLITRRQRG